MQVEIINKESFDVCGVFTELTTLQDENLKIIKLLWQNFNYELHLKKINLGKNWVKYGVTKRSNNQLTYMAAIPLIQPIDGFTVERIDGGAFAGFHHQGGLNLIKTTIHSIYTKKIPSANIVLDKNRTLIHYERYDCRFAWNKPNSIIDILVPVQSES